MSGAKTSEFISAWGAAVIASGFGLTDASPVVRAVAIGAVGFVMGCYALSRGFTKQGGAK